MKGGVKFYATPYSNIPLVDTKPKKLLGLHLLDHSRVNHYPPSFRSRSFYIRYKDEKVKTNEIC